MPWVPGNQKKKYYTKNEFWVQQVCKPSDRCSDISAMDISATDVSARTFPPRTFRPRTFWQMDISATDISAMEKIHTFASADGIQPFTTLQDYYV